MPIYDRAIQLSREEPGAVYVLSKSLYMELAKESERLLNLLLEGYEIQGKFINGIEYNDYIIRNTPENAATIEGLKQVIRNFRDDDFDDENAAGYLFNIWTYYDRAGQPDGKGADFIVVGHNGQTTYNTMFVDEPVVNWLDDFVKSILNIKQDKDGIITRLKKEYNRC